MKKIYLTYDQLDTVECSKNEQETAINWLRTDDLMTICTSDLTMVTKLSKLMAKDPDNYKCYVYDVNMNPETGRYGNYFFEVPKSLLSFRGHSKKRQLTAEEKAACRARFKKNKPD